MMQRVSEPCVCSALLTTYLPSGWMEPVPSGRAESPHPNGFCPWVCSQITAERRELRRREPRKMKIVPGHPRAAAGHRSRSCCPRPGHPSRPALLLVLHSAILGFGCCAGLIPRDGTACSAMGTAPSCQQPCIQQIKRRWQILIDGSPESKVPRFLHPGGDEEQQEEQQRGKPVP